MKITSPSFSLFPVGPSPEGSGTVVGRRVRNPSRFGEVEKCLCSLADGTRSVTSSFLMQSLYRVCVPGTGVVPSSRCVSFCRIYHTIRSTSCGCPTVRLLLPPPSFGVSLHCKVTSRHSIFGRRGTSRSSECFLLVSSTLGDSRGTSPQVTVDPYSSFQ